MDELDGPMEDELDPELVKRFNELNAAAPPDVWIAFGLDCPL